MKPSLLKVRFQAVADLAVHHRVHVVTVLEQKRQLENHQFRHKREHGTGYIGHLNGSELNAFKNGSGFTQLVVGVNLDFYVSLGLFFDNLFEQFSR